MKRLQLPSSEMKFKIKCLVFKTSIATVAANAYARLFGTSCKFWKYATDPPKMLLPDQATLLTRTMLKLGSGSNR